MTFPVVLTPLSFFFTVYPFLLSGYLPLFHFNISFSLATLLVLGFRISHLCS